MKNSNFDTRDQACHHYIYNNIDLNIILKGAEEIISSTPDSELTDFEQKYNYKLSSYALLYLTWNSYYETKNSLNNSRNDLKEYNSLYSLEQSFDIANLFFKKAPYIIYYNNQIGQIKNVWELFKNNNSKFSASISDIENLIFPNHSTRPDYFNLNNTSAGEENRFVKNLKMMFEGVLNWCIQNKNSDFLKYLKFLHSQNAFQENIIYEQQKQLHSNMEIFNFLSEQNDFLEKINMAIEKIEIENIIILDRPQSFNKRKSI